MKNKFFKFLFLTCLSLGILSGCKIVEIDVAMQTKYTVTFNSNGGTFIPEQVLKKGDKITKPNDPIKEGYTFVNWTHEGEEWNFIGYSVSKDMVLDANYSVNQYNLNLTKNIEDAGNVFGSGIYDYNEKISISAETNPGYDFIGWYKGDELVTSELTYTFKMPSKDISYEARYTINKYTITFNNQTEGVEIAGVKSGNSYDYGSNITLTASNIPLAKTIKWERSDGKKYIGNTYTFKMPSYNITITITLNIYGIVDNKICFGEYPQTEVKNSLLINELNTLSGTKPTSSNKYNWTDYNYYIGGFISSYMFYQDIDYDNDGTYDYRGVYFTQYRPYALSSYDCYSQKNNGYTINTIYWFSYDPIEWYILKEENGKALIISNLILDSQEYSQINHNGGEEYANNYELSNIRKFLNDNFYNIAFNDLQKEIIETTLVDNSADSTSSSSNTYACNDTNDKMFLLSYKEANTYYLFDCERQTQGSDYAKCQGLSVNFLNSNSYWWFRSPCGKYGYHASGVVDDGSCFYGNSQCVNFTKNGVRVACQIIL